MKIPFTYLLSDDEAAALYTRAQGDSVHDAAHDFDHVLRVARVGVQIALAEGADAEVVRLAALLHDIPVAAARADHHYAAARFAQALLAERGVEAARIENVVHCIEAHRFRDPSVMPQTLEARVLYDADKLDSMGAIGVLRAAAYAARHGCHLWTQPVAAIEQGPPTDADATPSHEFVFKLRRLLDTLHTETARRLGRERHASMLEFFAALDREMALSTAEDGYGVEGEAPSRKNR